ncbi:MAG TPA: protein-L-isoaspartate O-methyltransferase [Rhizomicrobium sp.]|jgi:protein-L-isoaspartate(D-aspartate) O-methyltransferase|nr:protein-L-isoaspartate O-methyltransferase [Rhizomicrobium sp.]
MSETMLAARTNMIDAQIRSADVTDPRIHAAMAAVARERFVPGSKRALAYADVAVEVSPGRFLLDPRSLAKGLQLAGIGAEDRVLDVGCATGYSSAVLGRLAKSVVALEQDADLVRIASETLVGAQGDIQVAQGGLIEGFKSGGPYDLIFVNGAIEARPDTLLSQLAEGGRLVAFLKDESRAMLFVRDHGQVGSRPGFDARVPVLAGFRKSQGFIF